MGTSRARPTAPPPPRRVDAQANRERILDVAEKVFGKGGEAASTEEVARLAKVGIATVFRHFPTKAALLQAVLVRRFERLHQQAQALAGAPEAGAALYHLLLLRPYRTQEEDRADHRSGASGGDSQGDAARASGELRQAVGALLRDAQRAGAVRHDVDLPEVYALLVATSRAVARGGLDEAAQARAVGILVDGLKAP